MSGTRDSHQVFLFFFYPRHYGCCIYSNSVQLNYVIETPYDAKCSPVVYGASFILAEGHSPVRLITDSSPQTGIAHFCFCPDTHTGTSQRKVPFSL